MLEALFNHLRSYGMDDLEFIIVNSKLSHSQEKLHELQKRVSFGVYQETDEEEVWSVMEGGKDDMFVYDRCGRLTYFVPFPLSILNESPLVSNAILATYFRSPCGVTCDQNNTLEIDQFVKNLESDQQNVNITEGNEDYALTEQYMAVNETFEDESSNNLLGVINSQNEFSSLNSTYSANVTYDDYEYPYYNDTLHSKEPNSTTVKETSGYLNVLYRLFFHNRSDHKFQETFNSNITTDENVMNETNTQMDNNDNIQNETMELHHHSHKYEPHEQQKTKKSDRCVEADYSVCKSWSKKRLLHAQKCCSSGLQIALDDHDHKSCHNFGKRRCKKIQSILKCCIKTLYTETTATTDISVETTEANEVVDTVVDAVCCKTTDVGKICRVSQTGLCEEDEFVEDSPSDSKCKNLP